MVLVDLHGQDHMAVFVQEECEIYHENTHI
jgi:hypothetical protein